MKNKKAFTPHLCIGAGFTLLELLIALSIFVTVMASLYSAFQSGIFGQRKIEEAIKGSQTARQILERINLDLKNNFIYSADEKYFKGDKNGIEFLALVDVFKKDIISQDYAYVLYKLDGTRLMRLCKTGREALNEKSEVKPEEMSDNIEGIEFSYGYINSSSEILAWQEFWDNQQELPVAVKVTLTLKNRTGGFFERTIYLSQITP